MSFLHGTEEYYQRFIELQEKLRRSEEERLKLEMKFNEMVQVSREEEQIYYRKLRAQYKRFLEEDRRRQERNEKILRILERIESRAAMLAAKTQRFELLRKQYHAYLQRVFINVKQQEDPQTPSRMPTIVEQKQSQNELVRSPKMDIVKQYLSSLSSSACRDEVLRTARSNELLPFSKANSEGYDLPKYKSNATNLAEQIIDSMHAKPKAEPGRIWQAEQSFCGTKLSPSKPSTRKSEDVELFDYGGTAGQYKFGGRKDLRHQLLEKYDNEKIVQDNYQNEKFTFPKEEDVPLSVRFNDRHLLESSAAEEIHFQKADTFPIAADDLYEDTTVSGPAIPKKTLLHKPNRSIPKQPHLYEPEVLESTNPKQPDYLQGLATTKSKDYKEEVPVNKESASYGNPDEERHFEEDNQILEADGTPETNIDACGEEICFEEKESRIEKEEFVHDFREDARLVAHVEETPNDGDQVTDQIKENFQGDVDEVKTTLQSDQNENQNEVKEVVVQEQVETPVDVEYKQKRIVVRDETRTQPVPYDAQNDENDQSFQHISNESDQAFQYASNEGAQPIQYDEHDQPIQYNEQGQILQYDEHGQSIHYDEPVPYDEHGEFLEYNEQGRPVQYDEQGQPISYDEFIKPIQYGEDGRLIQYDEQDQPIQHDEQGRPLQYDEQGQPISYDELTKRIQYGEDGLSIQYDEQGRPIQYDEQGRPLQYDEQGQVISYDELTKPVQYSEDGLPIQYDEQGRSVQYDEHGRLIQYDEHGHLVQYLDEHGPPVQYDEQDQPARYNENGRSVQSDQQGQPVQYDEQGQPIQYYDEQGQPVYQYDPNSEYYQQPYEDRAPDMQQQDQDKVDPPKVIEKGGTTSIVQPQNGKEKEVEGKKEEGEPVMINQKSNVLDMLDTDTESTRQEARVSNDSDFDFSNS